MIKLIDILNEGIEYGPNGNYVLNQENTYKDILYTGNFIATIKNTVIYYSIKYNHDKRGEKNYAAATDIKNLNGIDKDTLKPVILNTIKSMVADRFMFKKVYFLESSAPLSKLIAETIKDNYPDVELFPLYKIKYPTWKDMLIDDYETKIETKSFLDRVETAAKLMWEETGGKIKSSGRDTGQGVRNYFKPKYDLQQLTEPDILFVDDNYQTGKDYTTITNHYPPNQQDRLLFYAAVQLPPNSKESESDAKQKKAEKTKLKLLVPADEIPGIEAVDIKDLKSFSNKATVNIGASNKGKYYDLIKAGYIQSKPLSVGGYLYYPFNNPEITVQSVIDAVNKIKNIQERLKKLANIINT